MMGAWGIERADVVYKKLVIHVYSRDLILEGLLQSP